MSDFVDTWIIRAYLRVILTNVPRCMMALPCRTYRPLAWRCHLNSGGKIERIRRLQAALLPQAFAASHRESVVGTGRSSGGCRARGRLGDSDTRGVEVRCKR